MIERKISKMGGAGRLLIPSVLVEKYSIKPKEVYTLLDKDAKDLVYKRGIHSSDKTDLYGIGKRQEGALVLTIPNQWTEAHAGYKVKVPLEVAEDTIIVFGLR